MFTSVRISKDSWRIEERRSSPREALKRHVVLVFFSEDNWGKLTNVSESGMAFEFAKPPLLRERVSFTFQAMGCMPMPRKGKALCESFEVPGEIVWTREFERGAGVKFVDLAEASREQIRQWLCFETSANGSTRGERIKPELQQTRAKVLVPLAPESKTQSAVERTETFSEWDAKQTPIKASREPEYAFSESRSWERERYGAYAGSNQEEAGGRPPVQELPAYSHPSLARLALLVVWGCLAAFAVTAGVRIFMARAAHQADAEVRTSDPALGTGEPVPGGDVSSSVPAPVSATAPSVTSSSAGSAPPFQVDVLDAGGQSWTLWFVREGAKNKDSSGPRLTATKSPEAAATEEARSAHTFTMVAPNVGHPLSSAATGNSSAEAPAIQPDLMPSSGDPFGAALARQMAPAAPAAHGLIGGMVQQPRLIRATLPVYPQLAKATRVSGDVVVDALIDAAGKVNTVRVISGPVLLQQSAIETVRQWKYEPARLDGQAVAMHLTVTVKFRLN